MYKTKWRKVKFVEKSRLENQIYDSWSVVQLNLDSVKEIYTNIKYLFIET